MDKDGNIHLNFMKKTRSFSQLVHTVATSAAVISVRDQVRIFEEKNKIIRTEKRYFVESSTKTVFKRCIFLVNWRNGL